MSGFVFFFFKQKTAYEMRISDWSSDVCSSDLARARAHVGDQGGGIAGQRRGGQGFGGHGAPLSCFARLPKAPLRPASRPIRQGAMTGDIEGIGSAVTAGLAARAVESRHGEGKARGHAPPRCLT